MNAAVEVWRGAVMAEQLDEMGHLNVRYYVALAGDGLIGLAHHLGLHSAFHPAAGATLMVREHHIRFLREARGRAPLHMTAQVLEIGECDARVLFVLWHSLTGEPAASYNSVIAHVTADEARPFPWPSAARARASALLGDLPPFAVARSTPIHPVESQASVERAEALGLKRIAYGAFKPGDCDVFGRMEAEMFMGHIVTGIPQFGGAFRQAVIEHTEPRPARVGNAALEYRMIYLDWPRTGDLFEIRSGDVSVDARGMGIVHWLLDPKSGRAWGSCQAYIVTFDLDARKIMPLNDAAQAVLQEQLISGLGL